MGEREFDMATNSQQESDKSYPGPVIMMNLWNRKYRNFLHIGKISFHHKVLVKEIPGVIQVKEKLIIFLAGSNLAKITPI